MTARPVLDRSAIARHRFATNGLDARAPRSADAIRRAASAGFQDSWPRAAVLSLHARVDETEPDDWSRPPLVQVWGPRFNVFAVAEDDVAVFTMAREAPAETRRDLGIDLADRIADLIGDTPTPYREVGRALGVRPNELRYASPTGRIRVRWEGAGAPLVWAVPAPDADPAEARAELARRFLHTCGPASTTAFARWAGIRPRSAEEAMTALEAETIEVAIDGHPTDDEPFRLLADDLDAVRRPPDGASPGIRLLPSGDNLVLRWDSDRAVQVPRVAHRDDLWTTRVWPGALLIDGEIAGSWRRSGSTLSITPWAEPDRLARERVEAEAASLPLPPGTGAVSVVWDPAIR